MVNIHDNNFGVCSTAAATAAKTVTLNNNKKFVLTVGAVVYVKFTVANSAAVGSITLNVNNTGAKNIKYVNQVNIPGTGYLRANQTIMFMYDGTYWIYMSNVQHNTDTYDRIKYNATVQANSSEGVTSGKLIGYYQDGYHNLTTINNDGEFLEFNIQYPILYAASNINAGATGTNNYLAIPINLVNMFPTELSSLTPYKPVYLKDLTYIMGTMTIDSITQTPNESACRYVLLGYAYNTTSIYLLPHHPMYYYDGTQLLDYSSYSSHSAYTDVSEQVRVKRTTGSMYKITLNDSSDGVVVGPCSLSKSDSLIFNASRNYMVIGDPILDSSKKSSIAVGALPSSGGVIEFQRHHDTGSTNHTCSIANYQIKKLTITDCSIVMNDKHIYSFSNGDPTSGRSSIYMQSTSINIGIQYTSCNYSNLISVSNTHVNMYGEDIHIGGHYQTKIIFGSGNTTQFGVNRITDVDRYEYYGLICNSTYDDSITIASKYDIYIQPGYLNEHVGYYGKSFTSAYIFMGNIQGNRCCDLNGNNIKLPEIHNFGMMYSVTKGMDLLTCSTAAATAAKTVTHPRMHNDYIAEGTIILIRFTYTNTASDPTLKIGTGRAIPIYHHGLPVMNGKLVANTLYFFYHNDNSWEVVGTL